MKPILPARATLVAIALLASAGLAFASDLPTSKQTALGLYLSASEAAQFLQETPDAIMIDVRTPEEIDETGMAETVDALIPLAVLDHGRLIFNKDFLPGVAKLANDRKLVPDQPIVVICRSGNRSAEAVDAISRLGFTRVYTVTDGFEGDRAATGNRNVNGWKNAGLPWRPQRASSCAPAREGGSC
ncbi:rhodanese-related sulfurtransferase [Aliiruegeria haliotis]|uniref:Rhodanese-related sulfurtransferase n=1 Tax=Aliiruegeria haliotis TaxID=1280846 RepID=A0A2T0RW49_9RHOB|nr:rhodanese-like domain-containing protein [Aliiruegeria haliotis]PRY25401.1 rhodanese-related sulfurtransferase [Aliiruegeria haliotis]